MRSTYLALVAVLAATSSAAPAPVPQGANAGNCINFEFQVSDPSWYYRFDTGSTGQFSSLQKTCISGSSAMFFGRDAESVKGGQITKLEWHIDHSTEKAQSNIDVSIVEGYSLSMECTGFPSGATAPAIGGTTNLFHLGTCPHREGKNCVNDGGPSDTSNPWFTTGGYYWYDANHNGQTIFSGNPGTITCKIQD